MENTPPCWNKKIPSEKVGSFNFRIDPEFSGKKLTLKGYIRTENVSSGFAGLLLYADGYMGTLGFDNMASQQLKGTNEWKEYTVTIPYNAEETKAIHVGALLFGPGKIWLDNFHLLADDKDISLAPAYKKVFYKADLDTAFVRSSGVQFGELDKVKIDNLTNLGMIWGFLKYYHPAIAKGEYNWDAELFRILPNVLAVKSKKEFNTVIENWLDSFGKPPACSDCGAYVKSVIMPDYGWIFHKENLETSLVAKLEYIKNNRHQGKGYYIDKDSLYNNPVFKHEYDYKSMQYPDAGYRLLALFRYWNIVQYFFPYKHLIGEDWNGVLQEFIPKFLDAKNTSQYVLACLELIARIHDTHATIDGFNYYLYNYIGPFRVPVQAKMISDKLVITGMYGEPVIIGEKVRIGDVITKINGERTDELIRKNLYLIPASNDETQLRDIPAFILRGQTQQFTLEIERDGKHFESAVMAVPVYRLDTKLDYDPYPGDSSYKILKGNIGYLYPAKYRDVQFDNIKKTFSGTKGMIIDMRCYPSDFMVFSFGSYLKPASSPFSKFTMPDLDMPGSFRFEALNNNGGGSPGYYKKPVVIIVNALTQSSAEYTTMAFQSAPHVKVIGSMTAGADGDICRFDLPGGISTRFSGLGVYYPDGVETQRKGVKIDLIIHPTIKGITEGRDELLDKAIEIIDGAEGSDHSTRSPDITIKSIKSGCCSCRLILT